MNNEPKEVALRYKGEDYKDCTRQLMADGFQPKGFNEWYSPITGNTYRFVLASGGGYVTRVEQVSAEGTQLINTEFYDFNLAIKRYDAERSKPIPATDSDIKQGVIHALFKFSPNQFTKELQRISKAGDAYIKMLYDAVGIKTGERIPFKHYLFVNDGTEHLAIAVYSTHKRFDREELRTLQVGRKKLYFYRALRLPEDMIDSLLGRASLEAMIGAKGLHELTLPEDC